MNAAIIPAAGAGKRMGGEMPKQFLALRGKPVLAYSLEQFERSSVVDEIVVAAPEEFRAAVLEMARKFAITKLKEVVAGGAQRQHSVWNALQRIPTAAGIVIVHDAVRPLLTQDDILRAAGAAATFGAAILAARIKDTVKQSDEQAFVLNTLDREYLWSVQTPQAFKRDILFGALARAEEEHFIGTDEASVAEYYGVDVKIVEGGYGNIKITTPEDMVIAEALLARRDA